MTLSLNLTGRALVLVSCLVAAALAIATAAGALRTAPIYTVAGGMILSILITQAVAKLQQQSWGNLTAAVLESERTGKFLPNFPMNSTLPEVNRQAGALNAAAHSVLKSQEELEGAYLEFVETMAQALDARDPYTAGHSLRVAEYSYTLAKAMGLSDPEADTIRIAARLHDIGKIGIPDALLQKPGLLTAEEYGLIKLHPQIGCKILAKVRRFKDLLAVVELHHENHDGSGYPYGLSGTDVPVDARIVHVADAFDAMTTNRSYRTALSLRAAIFEVERNIGRQFDPEAARMFLNLIADGAIEIGSLRVSAQVWRESVVEVQVAV